MLLKWHKKINEFVLDFASLRYFMDNHDQTLPLHAVFHGQLDAA